MENPCRYCTEEQGRSETCHGSCNRHKRWKVVTRLRTKEEYKQRLVTMQLIDIANHQTKKVPKALKHGRVGR